MALNSGPELDGLAEKKCPPQAAEHSKTINGLLPTFVTTL
jgi:hypothetical protein